MLLQRRKRGGRGGSNSSSGGGEGGDTAAAARVGGEPIPQTAARGLRRLYSIHGLTDGKIIMGRIESRGGAKYQWRFTPQQAILADRKLVLIGRFSTRSGRGPERSLDGVRATLMATQGGIGAPPAREALIAATAQTANIATPEQKQEQAKAPETTLQPPAPPVNEAKRLPETESTGPLGFVGVMYFQLSPLDGRTLGIPLDLSGVQLNARLAPVDNTARYLQLIFSDLVAAAYGESSDEKAAAAHLKEINRVLAG